MHSNIMSANSTCVHAESLVGDNISQLPDDIVLYILSLLTMKEAARTSVLSHRWANLWTFIPELNFDAPEILDDLEDLDYRGPRKHLRNHLSIERFKYVAWVNQVVESYQGSVINRFRVRFDLDRESRNSINAWIMFAFKKKVKKLELDLSDYFGIQQQNKQYTFPDKNRETPLQLWYTGLISSSSLTSLHLVCVNVTGEIIEYFLHSCPFLEKMCLSSSDSLVKLKVSGQSLLLKYLEILHCDFIQNIEISAANLTSFKYLGPKLSMTLKYAPLLNEFSMGGDYSNYVIRNPCELSSFPDCLEMLALQLSIKDQVLPDFPVLNNLKQLELEAYANSYDCLLGFTSLIEACPFLHRFVLKLKHAGPGLDTRTLKRQKKCRHPHLKEVKFIGFVGKIVDVELALYVIKNAVKLEKISFDTREPRFSGFDLKSLDEEETEERVKARKRANRLRTNLHPTVHVEII